MPDTIRNIDNSGDINTTTNGIAFMRDVNITISHAALLADMEQLFTEARPRLLRLARLNGVMADIADDVVQETMMEAWRHLDNLRDPQRFDAWLDGICRNVCRRQTKDLATTITRHEPLPHLLTDVGEDNERAYIPLTKNACWLCHSPAIVRIIHSSEVHFPLPPDRYWIETNCPNCGKNESDIATILITHPVVQRFFLQHERGISEPYKLLEYNGTSVISARLTDVTSATQLTILLNAQTLQIIAVYSE